MKRNNKRSIKLENVKFKKIKRNILGVSLFIFCINLVSTSAFADSKVDTNIEQKEETIDNTISTNGDSDLNSNDENIVNADENDVIVNTDDENIINNDTDNDMNTNDGNNHNDEDRQVNGNTVVHIPDPKLRYALNAAIGNPENSEITQSQLEDLDGNLNLSNFFISDLTGLEYCINVKSINLYENIISDISPLKNLTKLTSLNLGLNLINDISALATLTELTHLDLGINQIDDIRALASLTKLSHLDLSLNYLTDISDLASLTELSYLNLSGNYLTDISDLASFDKLFKLDISGNGISNIKPLENLTELTSLKADVNQISDISILNSFNKLSELGIAGNEISNIKPLENLTGLTSLNISANKISDIKPLKNLNNLSYLDISANQISDISPLKDLNIPRFSALNQTITLDKSEVGSNEYSVENDIISKNSDKGKVTYVSDSGRYDSASNKVIWSSLNEGENNLSYKWNNATDKFSGTVMIKVIRTVNPNALIEIPKEIKMGDLKDDDINVGAEVTIKLTYDNSANLEGSYELYTEPSFSISEVENGQNEVEVGVYGTNNSMLQNNSILLMTLDASNTSQSFFIKAKKNKFEKNKKYSGSMTINIKYNK